jgi:hypothetical protein
MIVTQMSLPFSLDIRGVFFLRVSKGLGPAID